MVVQDALKNEIVFEVKVSFAARRAHQKRRPTRDWQKQTINVCESGNPFLLSVLFVFGAAGKVIVAIIGLSIGLFSPLTATFQHNKTPPFLLFIVILAISSHM
jgi:hypothetical protein